MGNDKHLSQEATHLYYFGKIHLFHIVSDDFPLPEDGIIGLPFFRKYYRYAITPNYLIIEEKKISLTDDGEYLPLHTAQVRRISKVM